MYLNVFIFLMYLFLNVFIQNMKFIYAIFYQSKMTSLFCAPLRKGENPGKLWNAIDYKKHVNFKDVNMRKNVLELSISSSVCGIQSWRVVWFLWLAKIHLYQKHSCEILYENGQYESREHSESSN